MMIKKVKVFVATTGADLETMMNEWLETVGNSIRNIQYHYDATSASASHLYTCMVAYEEAKVNPWEGVL